MVGQAWADAAIFALQNLWQSFVSFSPSILGAIAIFIAGWIIAVGVGKLVSQIFKVLRINNLLEKMGVGRMCERAGIRLDIGAFVGGLVKWFLIISFLVAVTDILRLEQLSDFLKEVLLYIPNVLIAVAILIISVLVANFLEKTIRASISFGNVRSAGFIALLARWAVLAFAVMVVLTQLGVAPKLIETILTGLVAMVALAGGLAFGLGGKDVAKDFLEDMRDRIRK